MPESPRNNNNKKLCSPSALTFILNQLRGHSCTAHPHSRVFLLYSISPPLWEHSVSSLWTLGHDGDGPDILMTAENVRRNKKKKRSYLLSGPARPFDPRAVTGDQSRRRGTFMTNIADFLARASTRSLARSSSCQTANWISWCETDMIVSSVIQFPPNNGWILPANQSGRIVPKSGIVNLSPRGPKSWLPGGLSTIVLLTFVDVSGWWEDKLLVRKWRRVFAPMAFQALQQCFVSYFVFWSYFQATISAFNYLEKSNINLNTRKL